MSKRSLADDGMSTTNGQKFQRTNNNVAQNTSGHVDANSSITGANSDDDDIDIFACKDFDAEDFINNDPTKSGTGGLLLTNDGGVIDLDALVKIADATDGPMNAMELEATLKTLEELTNSNLIQRQTFYQNSHQNDYTTSLLANEKAILDQLKVLEMRFIVETQLYPHFVHYKGVRTLLSLIPHDNINISIAACNILMGCLTPDELEPALSDDIIKPLVEEQQPQQQQSSSLSNYKSKVPQYNTGVILSRYLQQQDSKLFGNSYFILVAIFQLNGFSTIFELCLLLNDLLQPHRECLSTVLTTIETILEYDNYFFHHFLTSNLLHFLMIRVQYNEYLFINNDTIDITERTGKKVVITYDLVETKKREELIAQYGQQKVDALPPIKQNEMYYKTKAYENNNNLLLSAPQQIADITTNRLHAIELLALLCTIDTTICIDYLCSKPFNFNIKLYNTVLLSYATQQQQQMRNPLLQQNLNINDVLYEMQQKNNKTGGSNQMLKTPFFNVLYRYTLHTTAEACGNQLIMPQHTYFETLLDLFELTIAYHNTAHVHPSLEAVEFLNNMTDIFQLLLSTQTLHSTTFYITPAMKTAVYLQYNLHYDMAQHAHVRMFFVMMKKSFSLLYTLLRSPLCLHGMKLLDSSISTELLFSTLDDGDGDDEAQNTKKSKDTYITDAIQSSYTIICDALLGMLPVASSGSNDNHTSTVYNFVGLFFGYLEKIPSFKKQDDKDEFFSLLLSLHSNIITNYILIMNPPLDNNNTNVDNPNLQYYKKFIAKYNQQGCAKIQTLLSHIVPLFVSLYSNLPQDKQHLFNPILDSTLGYAKGGDGDKNKNTGEDDNTTFRFPVNIDLSGKSETNISPEDYIYAYIHGDEIFETFYNVHAYKALTSIAYIITAMYCININTIVSKYENLNIQGDDNNNQNIEIKKQKELSKLDGVFLNCFITSNININVIFNLVAEMRFYAGDTLYGKQLESYIELLYPLVQYFNTSQNDQQQ